MEILEESFSSQWPRATLRRKERKEKRYDENFVEENTSNMVGFSLNYLSQALCAFAVIGFIKREFSGLKIVLGGGLVSSWMKRPGWKNPFNGLVDHLVAGPGERPLLDLLGVKEAKQNHDTPDYSSLPVHDYLSPGSFSLTADRADVTGTNAPSVLNGQRTIPTSLFLHSRLWLTSMS